MSGPKCCICKSDIEMHHVPNALIDVIECPLCGYYQTSSTFAATEPFSKNSEEERMLFSGYVRNFSTIQQPLRITSDKYSSETRKEIIGFYSQLGVQEKIDMVVHFLGRQSKSIGSFFRIEYLTDFTRFYFRGKSEFREVIKYLSRGGIYNYLIMNVTSVLRSMGGKGAKN